MENELGIIHTFNNHESKKMYKIKEKIDDFVVQEVVNNQKCMFSALINLKKFELAEDFLKNLPDENISKEERKKIYSTANYHPFKRLFTKDNKFEIENKTKDIFVFTLLKYDYSANALNNLLSNRLNVPNVAIQTGGTKDRRGITLQEISINCNFNDLFNYALSLYRNNKETLNRYNIVGYNESIDVENDLITEKIKNYMNLNTYETTEQIQIMNIRRGISKKLGDLEGNYFTIKVRDYFDYEPKCTKFLNYFGLQRFGKKFNNHIVGKEILKQDFDTVLKMILSDECDYNPTQRMIKKLLEKDNKAKYIYNKIPRHVKMIYLHAYQSLIFNEVVNERFESNSVDLEKDRILVNDEFIKINDNVDLDQIYLELKPMEDKLLKGGYRKMIEEIQNLNIKRDDDGTIFSFFLNKSCYATIALRELIGSFESMSE